MNDLDNMIEEFDILKPIKETLYKPVVLDLDRELRAQVVPLKKIMGSMEHALNNLAGVSVYGLTYTHSDKNNFHNLKLGAQYDISKFAMIKNLKRKNISYWGYPEYTVKGVIHWHLLVWGPALHIQKNINSWKRNWGHVDVVYYPDIHKEHVIFNKVYSVARYYVYILKEIEKWQRPALHNNFV